MKKFIAVILVVISFAFIFTACGNYDAFDTQYIFDKAIVSMPDGSVMELEIKKWTDYDGEQLQITAKDGTVYLVSSFNCVLIDE